MRKHGIRLLADTAVTGFTLDDAGRVSAVTTKDESLDADLVVLGLGVTARSALAADAGLPLGAKDGIVVDEHQRVGGFDDIWAAGDCVVTKDRVTGELIHVPLGTHANKQGMVAADSIVGRPAGRAARSSASPASYVRRSPSSARWRSRARGWGSGRPRRPDSTP